jgi:AraC-like DNA-binding protein
VQGLPRLIELAGKPKAYLARAFQKYYQMSPSSYVNMLRMQQASWLLQMESGAQKFLLRNVNIVSVMRPGC